MPLKTTTKRLANKRGVQPIRKHNTLYPTLPIFVKRKLLYSKEITNRADSSSASSAKNVLLISLEMSTIRGFNESLSASSRIDNEKGLRNK